MGGAVQFGLRILGPAPPAPAARPAEPADVLAYRLQADAAVARFNAAADAATWRTADARLKLGLQHEQQH